MNTSPHLATTMYKESNRTKFKVLVTEKQEQLSDKQKIYWISGASPALQYTISENMGLGLHKTCLPDSRQAEIQTSLLVAITKALISLRRCAGWSVPLLLANPG